MDAIPVPDDTDLCAHGVLLNPFGWAAPRVAALTAIEPRLLAHLFELDKKRMHLIALVLAHVDDPPPDWIAGRLARGSLRQIMREVVGRCPAGLERALNRLPDKAMSATAYKRLLDLLEHPATAKELHHAEAINADDLRGLHALPAELRHFAVLEGLRESLHLGAPFVDAVRLIARRGGAASFEAAVADLAAQTNADQVRAALNRMIGRTTLPDIMPPATIGSARRMDTLAELQLLGLEWRNCVANMADDTVDGLLFIYRWDCAREPVACAVRRTGRLGWFLEEALGPANSRLSNARRHEVHRTFEAAGIPHTFVADVLRTVLSGADPSDPFRRRRRNRWNVDDE